MDACTQVLLKLSSPSSPSIVYLWEGKAFQSLLAYIPSVSTHTDIYPLLTPPPRSSPAALSSSSSPAGGQSLKALHHKLHTCLFQSFASSACASEHLRGAAKQHVEQHQLQRSGSLMSLELAEQRQIQLFKYCETIKSELYKMTNVLSPSPHPLVFNAISLNLSMATGLVRGTSSSVPVFACWILEVVQCCVVLLKHYTLYYDITHRCLKFLYRLTCKCLTAFAEGPANQLVTEMQAVVDSFARTHAGRVGDKEVMEEMCSNAAVIYKTLFHFVDVQHHIAYPAVSERITSMVVRCVTQLSPLTSKEDVFSHTSLAISYMQVLQVLMETHAKQLLAGLDINGVRCLGNSLQYAFLCGSPRLRNPAYEALHAAVKYLIDEQRELRLTSTDLTAPADSVDPFAESSDALHTLNRIMAETGMKIMFAAFQEGPQSKDLQWYSDAVFDILLLLAVRAYVVRNFFQRFIAIYNKSSPLSHVDDRCERVMSFVLQSSADGQRSVSGGMSRDMQRVKHIQLQQQFQQIFYGFLVEVPCS
eukprot:GHVQ01024818.1.p1 GENE.GHVQ01024818.1~~GHVQ01024818.1.p1  ORF type:complete len:611 (-),score=74.32 GHVQ01024818.1:1412-3007(-)